MNKTHTVRGWWPSEAEALALLEASANCERLPDRDPDFNWRINGLPATENAAIKTAQIRLALGYTDITMTLTSDMFAQLVQRVVELESPHH
jgi:hypothetical protein